MAPFLLPFLSFSLSVSPVFFFCFMPRGCFSFCRPLPRSAPVCPPARPDTRSLPQTRLAAHPAPRAHTRAHRVRTASCATDATMSLCHPDPPPPEIVWGERHAVAQAARGRTDRGHIEVYRVPPFPLRSPPCSRSPAGPKPRVTEASRHRSLPTLMSCGCWVCGVGSCDRSPNPPRLRDRGRLGARPRGDIVTLADVPRRHPAPPDQGLAQLLGGVHLARRRSMGWVRPTGRGRDG